MNDFSDIASALYFAGTVAIATGLVLLGVFGASLWSRKRRERREPERDFFQDITNISILFQSMRDVLRQQKELAAELNRDMERNTSLVRKAVEDTRAELARVRESQRELERQLEEARVELAISRHGNGKREHGAAAADKAEEKRPEPSRPRGNGNGASESKECSVLNILSEPHGAEPATSDASSWVGLDFGPAEERSDEIHGPTEAPTEPEDPQAARQAFRALLGMEEEDERASAVLTSKAASPDEIGVSNGVPLLSERVYEYCDAGMTVPQIARELGIGKGEVRLILSLRKDKSG